MFKCLDCKTVFEEPNEGMEYRGERFGEQCYEDMFYCAECGSDNFDEGTVCEKCGKFFSDWQETANGFCLKCIEESYSLDTALEFLEEKKLKDEFLKSWLNYDFMKSKLEAGDIEFISTGFLINDIKEELRNFCLEDLRDFAEIL